ncbi:MAG: hypothetical protein V3V03_00735 [Hyphomonadaceae bacterium]
MTKLDDEIIPYSGLDFQADGSAVITRSDKSIEPEVASGLLMRVVRRAAEAAADGSEVKPVTVNVNVTGPVNSGADVCFSAEIDRRTRTLVFASGAATVGGKIALAVTAVYRIIEA